MRIEGRSIGGGRDKSAPTGRLDVVGEGRSIGGGHDKSAPTDNWLGLVKVLDVDDRSDCLSRFFIACAASSWVEVMMICSDDKPALWADSAIRVACSPRSTR